MKTETILNNLLKVKDNPFKYMDVLENNNAIPMILPLSTN